MPRSDRSPARNGRRAYHVHSDRAAGPFAPRRADLEVVIRAMMAKTGFKRNDVETCLWVMSQAGEIEITRDPAQPSGSLVSMRVPYFGGAEGPFSKDHGAEGGAE